MVNRVLIIHLPHICYLHFQILDFAHSLETSRRWYNDFYRDECPCS